MTASAKGKSIGQVAELTGLSVHTLRYYEREGILPVPVDRDSGGRRVYTDDDVEMLTMCTMLRATGMPLARIREYTRLVMQGPGNEAQRLNILCQHRDQVSAKMEELRTCLEVIDFKVGLYKNQLVEN